VQTDAIGLHKESIASGHVERFGAAVTVKNEKPSFSVPVEAPSRIPRQLDPLKHEVWTGNEHRPFGGELNRVSLDVSWPSLGGRDCILDVQGALPTMIEETKRGVAALLDFCDDEPRADGMDRAGRHENGIA
jgi:hypothetical protein